MVKLVVWRLKTYHFNYYLTNHSDFFMPKFELNPAHEQAFDKIDAAQRKKEAGEKRQASSEATSARVTRETAQRKDEREANARINEIRAKLETGVLKDMQGLFNDNDMSSINESVDVLQEEGSGPEHDRALDQIETVAKKLQEAFGEEGEDKFNIWAKGAGINKADRESVSLGVFQLKEAA